MPFFRALQRLLLAGVLVLSTGVALAGNGPPPPPPSQDDNDDTDAVLMVVLGLSIGASVNCASDKPLMPGLCSFLGFK
jgi:hypothetical protein